MKVLITGGAGFLGHDMSLYFHAKNHQVRTFSRKAKTDLQAHGIEHTCGDIQNLKDLDSAMKNIDVVIHSAAKVGVWGPYQEYFQTNVIGTRNVLTCMQNNGIKKLVYTSSPSVVFGNRSLNGVDESTPYPNKHYCSYAKTKALAEAMVLGASKSHAIDAVSLRPHLIVGKNDPNLVPRAIEMAHKGRLKIIGNGKNQVDIVHVRNVSHAHLLAAEKLVTSPSSVQGRAFFIAQERPVFLWQFLNDVLTKKEARLPTTQIPFKLAYGLGAICEFLYKALGIKHNDPPMTRFIAMQLGLSHFFNHTQARERLDYLPILSLDELYLDI